MEGTTIFVAGHLGMVGSAIVRQLERDPSNIIVTASREEIDLTNQAQVNEFFANNRIDQVYLAAAKVGGIYANNAYPAEFIYENLMIETNVIHAAHLAGIQKLLFLGSSCIYPKYAEIPIEEEFLLSGKLEPTNEPYAIAKIAGIKLCESYNRQYSRDYRCVMPSNLYGPGDNYHAENSHVIPALIRRFHDAKQNGAPEVIVWGTGQAKREFVYVDDMAKACVQVMAITSSQYRSIVGDGASFINVGSGFDISIKELCFLIKKIVGYEGEIVFDTSKPDGTLRKLLSVKRLQKVGFSVGVDIESGLLHTYETFKKDGARC